MYPGTLEQPLDGRPGRGLQPFETRMEANPMAASIKPAFAQQYYDLLPPCNPTSTVPKI